MSKANKIKAYKKGYWAEYVAAAYLFLKGYEILVMRYKTKIGEADIIARKKDTLAVVEVKTRKGIREALESVSAANQKRVEQAARDFISRHPQWASYTVRFDIVALAWPFHLQHLDNAWAARS